MILYRGVVYRLHTLRKHKMRTALPSAEISPKFLNTDRGHRTSETRLECESTIKKKVLHFWDFLNILRFLRLFENFRYFLKILKIFWRKTFYMSNLHCWVQFETYQTVWISHWPPVINSDSLIILYNDSKVKHGLVVYSNISISFTKNWWYQMPTGTGKSLLTFSVTEISFRGRKS